MGIQDISLDVHGRKHVDEQFVHTSNLPVP